MTDIKNSSELIAGILDSYRQHEKTCRLDADNMLNRDILIQVLEKLRAVLFPGFFDPNRIRSDYIEYILGERIEFIQYHLEKQITRILCKKKECIACNAENCSADAKQLVSTFLSRIPKIRDDLATDVQAAFDGDPAAYSTEEIIFCYPGLYAITVYRIAHELWTLGVPMIPRIMTEHAHSQTGIDIHPGATIGKYFFIDHGTGIVIGETTTIGDNCKIYQGVTLGALSTRKGQQLRGSKRHPTLGNNVTIYAGTTVLGGETVIGDNTTIGGNAFIVNSVSSDTKVSVKNPELTFSGGRKKLSSEKA